MSSAFTLIQVSSHNTTSDLWIVINDEIYDVTEFQKTHPGGDSILNKWAGKDATKPFRKTHNENILKMDMYMKLCVGSVKDNQERGEKVSTWKKLLSSLGLRGQT
ncbi:cytochrome b5 [Stipitochalara longipes BDJ]|nr:cytochrome b5 [Stipitochalara longipes BDJ]